MVNKINTCVFISGNGSNLKSIIKNSRDYNFPININLSKIKTRPIFKWLKKNNISDSEMLKTFNCGIGFCLIANKKNLLKIKKIFTKEYQPYEIGFVSKEKSRINIVGKIKW